MFKKFIMPLGIAALIAALLATFRRKIDVCGTVVDAAP
jgi:hypothetical protein